MKHIPHHDIDAAREWSDQCLQPPWASLNTTPLLTTAQYHTTAEQWLLLRRWWSSRGSGWQCFKDFLFTITPIWYYINPHLLWSSSPWSWSSQPLSPLNIFPYWAPLYICFLLLKAITQTISLSCYIIIIYIKILLCVKDLLPLLWIFWSVQLLWVQSTAALQNGLVLQWGENLIFPCLTQYLVRAANP